MMRVLAALADLDHLLRFYQLGFVAIWPLLGCASVSGWSAATMAGLLAIAFCFNIYGVVLDDALHVDLDRTDPLRADGWVVRGTLAPRDALLLVALQVPLMIGIHFGAGFEPGALIWVAAAVLCMTLYDVYGKTSRIPPIAEAAQGACAFVLVLYGASVAGEPSTPLMWPTAAAGAAFLLLVNAFHGGLRDIDNEITLNQRTMPIWLGCRGTEAGKVHISGSMSFYAGIWLTALAVCSFMIVFRLPAHERSLPLVVAIVVMWMVNVALFVALHRIRKPGWDFYLRLQVLTLPVPTMIAFIPRLAPLGAAVLFAIYLLPTLFIACWWRTRAADVTRKAPDANSFLTESGFFPLRR